MNNTELVAKWDSLLESQKLEISKTVGQETVNKVLKDLKANGKYTVTVGGYLGQTNPSLALSVVPSKAEKITNIFGDALAQDSMVIVSEIASEGLSETGAVTIELDGQNAKDLYDNLWKLKVDGENIVGGYNANDETMTILNFGGINNDEYTDLIDDYLGGER